MLRLSRTKLKADRPPPIDYFIIAGRLECVASPTMQADHVPRAPFQRRSIAGRALGI